MNHTWKTKAFDVKDSVENNDMHHIYDPQTRINRSDKNMLRYNFKLREFKYNLTPSKQAHSQINLFNWIHGERQAQYSGKLNHLTKVLRLKEEVLIDEVN